MQRGIYCSIIVFAFLRTLISSCLVTAVTVCHYCYHPVTAVTCSS